MSENNRKVPEHIAIIMDGNGRWAQKRGLPRTAGHSAGAETFRKIATYCKNIGVKYLTVYAFSTENWSRPEMEVRKIMELLQQYLKEADDTMLQKQIRLRVLGDVEKLPLVIRRLITETEKKSQKIEGFQANICINYGGRDEIVNAAKKYALDYANGKAEPLTEELFSSYIYSKDIPDPDLLIRPGGELRLSNFLLWQLAYTEFYFTDVLWPDFDESVIDAAIDSYNDRERRYGGVTAK